jgi:hypothetical protein
VICLCSAGNLIHTQSVGQKLDETKVTTGCNSKAFCSTSNLVHAISCAADSAKHLAKTSLFNTNSLSTDKLRINQINCQKTQTADPHLTGQLGSCSMPSKHADVSIEDFDDDDFEPMFNGTLLYLF